MIRTCFDYIGGGMAVNFETSQIKEKKKKECRQACPVFKGGQIPKQRVNQAMQHADQLKYRVTMSKHPLHACV